MSNWIDYELSLGADTCPTCGADLAQSFVKQARFVYSYDGIVPRVDLTQSRDTRIEYRQAWKCDNGHKFVVKSPFPIRPNTKATAPTKAKGAENE